MKGESAVMNGSALRGRMEADAAVIGGGLSGLSVALRLSEAGLKVVLLEARRIGWGASGANAGIAALFQRLCLSEWEKDIGMHAVKAYIDTHVRAIHSIKTLSRQLHHRFEMQKVSGWLYAENKEETKKIKREAETMLRAGLKAELQSGERLENPCTAALKIPYLHVLDPMAYLNALLWLAKNNGVQIYEQSRVIAVETDAVYTEEGSVRASAIVVTSGYPIINIPGWYFMRLEQKQIRLERGNQHYEDVWMDMDGNRVCKPCRDGCLIRQTGVTDDGDTALERKAAMECFTPDGLPYIGPYSARTPNMFVACGYGGNGIAGSMVAAYAIAGRILGLPVEEYDIYSPERKMKNFSVPLRLGERYLKGILGGLESPRCSHMGCRLIFDPISRLWECPCHGSRFDDIGRVMNAPAVHPVRLRGRK